MKENTKRPSLKQKKVPRAAAAKSPKPDFATESEEAMWWYKNRNVHAGELQQAVKNGKVATLTKELLLQRLAANRKNTPSPVVALRIPEADLALARKQAGQKGLPYQTYIKSLLHETLTAREKRKAG